MHILFCSVANHTKLRLRIICQTECIELVFEVLHAFLHMQGKEKAKQWPGISCMHHKGSVSTEWHTTSQAYMGSKRNNHSEQCRQTKPPLNHRHRIRQDSTAVIHNCRELLPEVKGEELTDIAAPQM